MDSLETDRDALSPREAEWVEELWTKKKNTSMHAEDDENICEQEIAFWFSVFFSF